MRSEVAAAIRALAALAAGMAIGALLRPPLEPTLSAAYIWLYIVIAAAGFYVGRSWREVARAGRRIILDGLAFAGFAVAGDVAAGVVVSAALGLPANLVVAAALGSGWYSFTGPYLATLSPIFGVIGLVANQLREDYTLAFFPALYSYLGPPAVIMGGATSMDTTLGVTARYAGARWALVGLVQGVVLTAIIPVLVPTVAMFRI